MIIKGLELQDFRCFRQFSMELKPGVNIILGPNESGKSTLIEALLLAFFERPDRDNKRVRASRSWDSSRAPRLTLEIENEGIRYLLVKDFEESQSLLKNLLSGEEEKGLKVVESRLQSWLGISRQEDYLRTACIRQDEMLALMGWRGAERMASTLRDSVADRGYLVLDRAIGELEGDMGKLEKGLARPVKDPGEMVRLNEEIVSIRERFGKARESADSLAEKEKRLAEVEKDIAILSPSVQDTGSLLEKNAETRKLEEEKEKLLTDFQGAGEIIGKYDRVKGLGEKIEKEFSSIHSAPKEQLNRALELLDRKKLLNGDYVSAGSGPEGKEEKIFKNGIGWMTLMAFVFVVLAGVGAWLGIRRPGFIVLAVLGVLGFSLAVFLIQKMVMKRRVTLGELARIQMEGVETDLHGVLDELGYTDVESLSTDFLAWEESRRDKREAEIELEALLGGKSIKDVERDRAETSLKAQALEEKLKQLELSRLDPLEIESLSRELQEKRNRLDELKREKEGLDYLFAHGSFDAEEAIVLEEKMAWLESKRNKLNHRLEVMKVTHQAMSQARESAHSFLSPLLVEGMERALSPITGGRYQKVEVDPSDLSISVFSQDKGDFVLPEQLGEELSQGTLHQVYLSARLELISLACGDKRPPIIFDESFVYFDRERITSLKEVLEAASREHQILIFSSHDWYRDLWNEANLIEMPRPDEY